MVEIAFAFGLVLYVKVIWFTVVWNSSIFVALCLSRFLLSFFWIFFSNSIFYFSVLYLRRRRDWYSPAAVTVSNPAGIPIPKFMLLFSSINATVPITMPDIPQTIWNNAERKKCRYNIMMKWMKKPYSIRFDSLYYSSLSHHLSLWNFFFFSIIDNLLFLRKILMNGFFRYFEGGGGEWGNITTSLECFFCLLPPSPSPCNSFANPSRRWRLIGKVFICTMRERKKEKIFRR